MNQMNFVFVCIDSNKLNTCDIFLDHTVHCVVSCSAYANYNDSGCIL